MLVVFSTQADPCRRTVPLAARNSHPSDVRLRDRERPLDVLDDRACRAVAGLGRWCSPPGRWAREAEAVIHEVVQGRDRDAGGGAVELVEGLDDRERSGLEPGGPLAPFAEMFRARLNRSGYALQSQAGHLRLMADLSRWLVEHRLNGSGSSPEVVAGSCWTGELPVTGTRARLDR